MRRSQAGRLRHVVQAFGFAETAHASQLDIDHAAGMQPNGLLGVVGRADRFVQANRGFEQGLQLGVVDDVVVRQRLLDHHQVEFVQLSEVLGVGQGIRRIRVGHQPDGGKPLADAPHHVHVPTRFNLDLDALVAGLQLFLDESQQLFDRILNADGDAARDLPAGAAAMPTMGWFRWMAPVEP